jgi:hypothetical protein
MKRTAPTSRYIFAVCSAMVFGSVILAAIG